LGTAIEELLFSADRANWAKLLAKPPPTLKSF